MPRAVTCALTVLLLLLISGSASARRRHPSLVIEDAYRAALTDFALGSPVRAIGRVVVLEGDSSPLCLEAIEFRTAELLARREPESIVVQAFLRLAVRQARYKSLSPSRDLASFERVSITGIRRLVDRYVASSQQSDASSVAAGLLTYMAQGVGSLHSSQRLGAAKDLLESAESLDRNHRAALHSLAVVLELMGRPGQALPYLDRLLALEPDDPRFRVRRAILTVKSGRLEQGQLLLEELTSDGPIWARDLATQELARLLLANGQEVEAAALLRQALHDLPPEKLRLQLAALLDPDWTASWETLSPWLAEPHEDAGRSARWIYEDGAKEELDALRLKLGSGVSERLPGLENALRRLPRLPDSHRRTVAGCR